MKLRNFTTGHYTAIVATLAFLSTGVIGVYFTKLSHDLDIRKEERELRAKEPVVDLDVRPNRDANSADFTISFLNRGDGLIAPQDITILPSLEWGQFYLSGPGQSIDALKSTLNLQSMGTVSPTGAAKVKGVLAGATDGNHDAFKTGAELQFVVRLRLSDEKGTVRIFPLVRQVSR